MSNFEYDTFSPMHPVRRLRSDLEDLERAINLMEACYGCRFYALEQEMIADFEALRQQLKQVRQTDYWNW